MGNMPETPFVGHLGSPHGPKHRSAQTDGLSGQLSRGRGRERWIPTCRRGDSLCSLTIWRDDVGCVCWRCAVTHRCGFTWGLFVCHGYFLCWSNIVEDYKDSHMFLSKLKKDKEFGKKKHTHTLSELCRCCYRFKKFCSGFWHTSQDSCWENHKHWIALCGDFWVEQMGGI